MHPLPTSDDSFKTTAAPAPELDGSAPRPLPAVRSDAAAAPLRLLFVNLDFPPVTGPGIWRVMAFAKYSALYGHEVHVICSDRASWHTRTDPSLLAQLPDSLQVHRLRSRFMHEILASIRQREEKSRFGLGKRVWGALHWRVRDYFPDFAIHWGAKAALTALRNARRWRPACVITTGPQHISHLTGLVLKKFARVPWVMDYRDPWTGNPTQGQYPQGPYQSRLHEWLERKCVQHADLVTVVTPTWRDQLAQRYAAIKADERFVHLPNGHDLGEMPSSGRRIPEAANRLWLHFNGTLQTGNDSSASLFVAMDHIRAVHGDHAVPVVSFCGMPEKSKALASQLGLDRYVVDVGPLPYQSALATCLGADVLLVLVKTGDSMQKGVVPGKIYEAMALAKPIFAILPDESDVRTLLADYPDATISTDAAKAVIPVLESLLERHDKHALHGFTAEEKSRLFSRYMRRRQTEDLLRFIGSLQQRDATV